VHQYLDWLDDRLPFPTSELLDLGSVTPLITEASEYISIQVLSLPSLLERASASVSRLVYIWYWTIDSLSLLCKSKLFDLGSVTPLITEASECISI
jgi:hypothetical protein